MIITWKILFNFLHWIFSNKANPRIIHLKIVLFISQITWVSCVPKSKFISVKQQNFLQDKIPLLVLKKSKYSQVFRHQLISCSEINNMEKRNLLQQQFVIEKNIKILKMHVLTQCQTIAYFFFKRKYYFKKRRF